MNPITPARFAKWISAHRPCETVGFGFDNDACPLATYLSELFEVPVSVDNDAALINGEDFPLPRWAKKFVSWVDGEHPRRGRITAKEAMRCFEMATGWFAATDIYAKNWRRAA